MSTRRKGGGAYAQVLSRPSVAQRVEKGDTDVSDQQPTEVGAEQKTPFIEGACAALRVLGQPGWEATFSQLTERVALVVNELLVHGDEDTAKVLLEMGLDEQDEFCTGYHNVLGAKDIWHEGR